MVNPKNGVISSDDPKRKIKYNFIGRGIVNRRDSDFIDLDALTRNIECKLYGE